MKAYPNTHDPIFLPYGAPFNFYPGIKVEEKQNVSFEYR